MTAEQVASWQSELLDKLSPSTVAGTRSTLVAVLGAAQDLGLVAANVAHRVKPPRVPKSAGRAITPAEVRALLAAASSHRLGAALALLFVQGWRVSEVLGLAWQDVDLDQGTAHVVRAAVYVDGAGMVLGPTKTSGAMGVHPLAPGVVEALRRRLERQCVDRAAAGQPWVSPHEYKGDKIDLVFTTTDGRIVTRQMITKVIAAAADQAGLASASLGTHVGRRSVITALYAHGGASIEDIAHHVGHDSTTTTAGYIKDLGRRPRRIIVATTDLWSANAEKSLEGHAVPVERIGIDDLDAMTIDWSTYDVTNPAGLRPTVRKEPWSHQVKAVEAVRAGFEKGDRGKLIMACGTGKTFTALRIAEEHAGAGKSVLFLAPSIALVAQSLKEWTAECNVPIRPFAVCSDVTAGRPIEGENATPHDLVVPPTTDHMALIGAGVHKLDVDEMTVVFSTYQSIQVVADMQATTCTKVKWIRRERRSNLQHSSSEESAATHCSRLVDQARLTAFG